MAKSKSEERREAVQTASAEAKPQLKKFYFPTIGQGTTVFAASLEEAEEKAQAILRDTTVDA